MKTSLAVIFAGMLTAAANEAAATDAQSPPFRSSRANCRAERDAAIAATGDSTAAGVRATRRDIDRGLALFRFHRSKDATAAIETAEKRLGQGPTPLATEDRARLIAALTALRSCVSSAIAPDMATLTLHTNYVEENADAVVTRSAGGGVYIRVEDIPVGRTTQNGTLTTQVPSGALTVTAIVPPNAFGWTSVQLSPGGTGAVTIALDQDKEVSDETDLVLIEADEGVLFADTTSVTLQFMVDQDPVAIERIIAVELLDTAGGVTRDLTSLFAVSETTIMAVNPNAVLNLLLHDASSPIRLRISAADSQGFMHDNVIEFRIRNF
jgi:hypothetical protein